MPWYFGDFGGPSIAKFWNGHPATPSSTSSSFVHPLLLQVEVLSRVSEAQQPSPTDSGFTEDSRAFADLSNGRSKSYGNLSGEDKENRGILATARSLDEVSWAPLGLGLELGLGLVLGLGLILGLGPSR